MLFSLTPFLIVLSWAAWLLWPVSSVLSSMRPITEAQAMTSYNSQSSSATWLGQTFTDKSMDVERLYRIANGHFNWVKSQPDAVTKQGHGSLLVAALWIPSKRTVFASTIPRGKYATYMFENLRSGKDDNEPCLAPVWRSRARDYSINEYHAEDGAYFMFEMVTGTFASLEGNDEDIIQEAARQKYEAGTLLAVWGYHFYHNADTKRTGRPIQLCDYRTISQRNPNCQSVASSLQVTFDQITDDQTVANEEDLFDEVPDADLANLCARADPPPQALPRDSQGHARQDGSCSTFSLAYAPTPLTIQLDGSPSPTASTASVTSTQQPGTITPGPSLSCFLHNQDPDQGILKPFCLCNKSITLSPLPATSAQSDSCAYSTKPGTSASEAVPTQTQVWTTNCQACTLVGGIADERTCTPVAGCQPTGVTATAVPTIAAWVANSTSIDIGDAEDANNGTDLAKEMFAKLKAMCDGKTCKGTPAIMYNVEAILRDEEEPLKPAMIIEDAVFSEPKILDQMLAVGISAWIGAMNNQDLGLCKEVEYQADMDETGSGCGKGPIQPSRLRRKVRRDTGAVLWERSGLALEDARVEERCSGDCGKPRLCHYTARMCNAPTHITVVMAGANSPYTNHLDIHVQLEATPGDGLGFICELVTDVLTGFVAWLAPELLGPDVMGEIDLQAICRLIEDPVGFIGNLTQTVEDRPSGSKAEKPKLLGIGTLG